MSDIAPSWGRVLRPREQLQVLHDRLRVPELRGDTLVLARGQGRSYGDVALNDGGRILQTGALDRWIAFDREHGTLDCEAGVTLAQIIALVLPQGWFLPVTPGTRFVSVGGAIANDVHGKNHHLAGSFGCHLDGFELLRSDGQRHWCSATQNAEWFAATIGGLGLTGLITRARLRLLPVPGALMHGDSQRFGRIDEFFALADEADRHWPYTVAWIDCAARGAQQGRGVFERARHAAGAFAPEARAWRVPLTPPVTPLNSLTLRAFNTLYFHRPSAQRRDARWPLLSFFYPLDRLREWNRLYGPRGFYQFQCLLPPAGAAAALRELLDTISRAGEGSCLAVVKRFGARRSPGLMSFCAPGTTLALDFANRGAATRELLARLEAITVAAGGRLYPAKDACMSAASFAQGYPQLETFSRLIDPAFSSSFWRRVNGA